MENAVHHVIKKIHQMPDIERILETGPEEHLKNWHRLGTFDEDEILRRMELHMEDMPQEITKNQRLVIELIEKRRRKLKERILKEHPEVLERLEENRKRLEEHLEKQNPEAVQKWKEWKNKGDIPD